MNSVSSARNFCKTARCPSSETLLHYPLRIVAITKRITIQRHLRDCDFCCAELELLKRHRHEVEDAQLVEIPSRVRRLAESVLLRNRTLTHISNVVVYSGRLSH